jgi:serine/threonine protein kinase
MATAFQLQRNIGIGNINIDETPTIIKKLKGGSFANTYLIEKEGKEIVRKYIEKTKDLEIHVNTLKRQYDDIKRFSYYSPNLMPKIYNSGENESEFYYDMEYLYGYSELSHYSSDIIKNVTTRVLDVLYSDIYCYSKVIDGKLWMTDFINEKIIPKYKYLESINSSFYTILNSESIIINGKILPGLKKLFSTLNNNDLYPDSVSPIHGDLTLENILYNSELDTFKLIDMSGSRYVDIKEMDYAKLLQSLMAKYEVWINISDLKIVEDNNSFTIDPIYLDVNNDSLKFLFNSEKLYKRSVFILGTYFIRMIPFLHKVSTQHALFGLLLGTYYSSYFSDLNILNK